MKVLQPLSWDSLARLEEFTRGSDSKEVQELMERILVMERARVVADHYNSEAKTVNDVFKTDPQPPLKPHRVKFNEAEYWEDSIRGYRAKLKSIKSIVSHKSSKEIREALIRCKGKEEVAIEALLTEQMPSARPPIPKEARDKHNAEQDAIWEKYLRETEEHKETLEKIKESRNRFTLQNIFDPEIHNDLYCLRERKERVRTELSAMQNEIGRLKADMNMEINIPMIDEGEDEIEDPYRLYVPGEKGAINKNHPMVATFKQERTFALDMNNIHFRVAEATLHRMLPVTTSYDVLQVDYLITPALIQQFHLSRRQIAFQKNVPITQVRPYLMTTNHGKLTQKLIDWIRLNNIKMDQKGQIFSCNHNKCGKWMKLVSSTQPVNYNNNGKTYTDQDIKKVMLFLVLTGVKAKKVNSSLSEQIPSGYDSLIHTTGQSIKVKDQTLVLPYYVVHFVEGRLLPQKDKHTKTLDEAFKDMEEDAETDRFQNEAQKYYQEALKKKGKSSIISESAFFDQVYAKQNPKVPETPDDVNVDEFVFDDDDDTDTPTLSTPMTTPMTGISEGAVFDDEPSPLTAEEKRLLIEAGEYDMSDEDDEDDDVEFAKPE